MKRFVRLATTADAAGIHEIYAPEVIETPISFEVVPPGIEEMARRIRETTATYPWLVCEDNGTILGYAYAGSHHSRAAYRWSIDVSVYLHRQARRQGLGRALYTALLDILPRQGFYRAFAGITLPNPASVGVHEAMGFKPVGVYHHAGFKHGAWYDVGWWELPLQPLVAAPAEPVPLLEMLDDAVITRALARGSELLAARD